MDLRSSIRNGSSVIPRLEPSESKDREAVSGAWSRYRQVVTDRIRQLLDPHMREVLKSSSSALAISVLGTLLGFAVSLMIARLLGAKGAGVYFLALSVATIASTFGRFGLDNTVVRSIAAHASAGEWVSVRKVYASAIKIVGTLSLIVSLLFFVGSFWLADFILGKPAMGIPLMLTALAVVPLSLSLIQAELLRGLKQIAASQFVRVLLVPFCSLVLLYYFVQWWQVNGVVGAYVAATGLSVLVSSYLCRSILRGKPSIPSVNLSGDTGLSVLLQSSFPFLGVAITGVIITQCSTVMLGVWGSMEDVGIFNVANRLASLLLFPLMAMISILSPKFAALHRQGAHEDLATLARRSSMILMVIVVPAAGVVAFTAEWVLGIFGAEFVAGAMVLRLLLIGVVVNAATGAVAELLMMTGYATTAMMINAVGAMIILGGSWLLIPFYGGLGAAIALTTGYVILNISMTLMVWRHLRFNPVGLK